MAIAAKCRIWAGLACAWRTLPHKNHLTEKQSLIHSIDREADSVYHLRGWDAAGHPFLVRMRGYSGVARDGKVCKARAFGREPGYSFYKNVHYQGKQVVLKVAETEVVPIRQSNVKRGKGRHAPLKAKIICVRLKTAKKMAPWILLTNAGITAWEAAQYDNCLWRIETTANC